MNSSSELFKKSQHHTKLGALAIHFPERKIELSGPALRLLGLDGHAQLNFEELIQLHTEENRERVKGILASALEKFEGFSFESQVRRADNGEILDLRVMGYREDLGDGKSRLLGLFEDITETKQLQRHHSEDTNHLFQVLSVLSHEINSPLNIILAHAQSMKKKLARGELDQARIESSCDSIEKTVDRISDIIKRTRNLERDRG